MKSLVLLIGSLFSFHICEAQIISQFSWDSNPVTTADIGPNAISVSSSAVSTAGGVGGTNGLNAGLSTNNLDFTLAETVLYDVSGIDFSIDYQSDGEYSHMFTRGSSLIIGAGSTFNVVYRVENGSGGYETVRSGNVYIIPNDDIFRTYRFYYLPATGEGFLTVNGEQVWTNDGPDNRYMYWVDAGQIVIGANMDARGVNKPSFDNMTIGAVLNSALPVELTKFSVTPVNSTAVIEWTTESEKENDYFEIEKSEDGNDWELLNSVKGKGNSAVPIDYKYIDYDPFPGTSYYRLRQIDMEGRLEIFEPVSVDFTSLLNELSVLSVFPNPAENQITVGLNYMNNLSLKIFNSKGKLMQQVFNNDIERISLQVDVSNFPTGIYIISDGKSTVKFSKL